MLPGGAGLSYNPERGSNIGARAIRPKAQSPAGSRCALLDCVHQEVLRLPHPSGPGRGPTAQASPGVLSLSLNLTAGRITLVGVLNRRSAHHLLDAIRALSATAHQRWVMDTEGMRSCDSSGLRTVGACYRTALRHGAQLRIVGAAPWFRQALATVRLDGHLLAAGGTSPECAVDRTYPLVKVSSYSLASLAAAGPIPAGPAAGYAGAALSS